jgi:putative hydrolase of the HAD superfamily
MTPRAIFFDLDDTIADTSGTILEDAERAALRALVENGLRTDFDTGWATLREIRATDPGAKFLKVLVDRFGADDPHACHAASRRVFFASRPEEIGPVPGAFRVLRELRERGISLHLVTFGVPEAQAKKIQVLGIRDFFEEVHIVPLSEGPDKQAVFARLLAECGLAAEDVWVVGDRTPGEIRAGNALGMKTIRIRRGEFAGLDPSGPAEEPDLTIADLRELPALLSA